MAFLGIPVMILGNIATKLINKKELKMRAKKTKMNLKRKVMSEIVKTIQAIGVSALAGKLL